MKLSIECGADCRQCCIPTISAKVECTSDASAADVKKKKDQDCIKCMTRIMSILIAISCVASISLIVMFDQFPIDFPQASIDTVPTCPVEQKEQILILSAFIGDPLHFGGTEEHRSGLYRELSENKRQYAAQWDNMHYLERNEAMVPGLAHWTKPFYIRSIMRNESYSHIDWIVWMDADIVILNCSVSILDLIDNHSVSAHSQINSSNVSLVFNGDDNSVVNNGVFAIRNDQWALDFVEKWVFLKESGTNQWAETFKGWKDQNLFIALLFGWDPHRDASRNALMAAREKGVRIRIKDSQSIPKALKAMAGHIQKHVAMMPQRLWNSYERDAADTFIMHCAGSTKCKQDIVTNHLRTRSNCAALSKD